MSLYLMAIAGFLYFEIALCILLMLPFVSATRWQKIFRSKILQGLGSYAHIYFNIFVVVLLLLFFDSIRDMNKYTEAAGEAPDLSNNPMAESVNNMKLFRAQRNFYIAGFALFLFVVLRKLVTMISVQAQLIAESEAVRKQAESASAAARAMLEEKAENQDNGDKETQEIAEELKEYKVKVQELRNELATSKSDLEAMKKQAESTNREYDRLTEEHAALQAQANDGSKKDD